MANPHFLRASATCDQTCPDSNLQVCFKLAGLGDVESAVVTASASAMATYRCINRGGQPPQAENKITILEDVFVSGTFPVRNGQTTGCLCVPPPGPGDFHCPPGQTLVLVDAQFTNVVVEGEGASQSIPGNFDCV